MTCPTCHGPVYMKSPAYPLHDRPALFACYTCDPDGRQFYAEALTPCPNCALLEQRLVEDAEIIFNAKATHEVTRAELETVKRQANDGVEWLFNAHVKLDAATTELARVTEQLLVAREALEDISSKLDCASPCGPTRITCRKCGDTEEDWCAGCVARAALAATADSEG